MSLAFNYFLTEIIIDICHRFHKFAQIKTTTPWRCEFLRILKINLRKKNLWKISGISGITM